MGAVAITHPLLNRFAKANLTQPADWRGGSVFRSPWSIWVSLMKSKRVPYTNLATDSEIHDRAANHTRVGPTARAQIHCDSFANRSPAPLISPTRRIVCRFRRVFSQETAVAGDGVVTTAATISRPAPDWR